MTDKPDDLIAFIDESKRPTRNRKTGKADLTQWHYVLAAVAVMRTDINAIRQQLLQIEANLNYQLHYSELGSAKRRRDAIDSVSQIVEWEGYITETNKPIRPDGDKERGTRDLQLHNLFLCLSERGVTQAIIETRVKPNTKRATLDENDITTLRKLRQQKLINNEFRLEHVGKSEPMLKIADLLASSRTDMLCVSDQAIYPRISHRAKLWKPEQVNQALKSAETPGC